MIYKIIIPARSGSKRLPGKNTKLLGEKPLICYTIDFSLKNFSREDIWINTDDSKVLSIAKKNKLNYTIRPNILGTDKASTVDVLKYQVNFFVNNRIKLDAIILLQPTSPFRSNDLIRRAISCFEKSKRSSLATFSPIEKKICYINDNKFKPLNYEPGQRSQDLSPLYYENGSIYITKCENILAGKIITKDVYPMICKDLYSTIDIDYEVDFNNANYILSNNFYD